MMKFKITASTNVGLVRKNNEDNFIVCPNLNESSWFIPNNPEQAEVASESGCLLCVADGMGGMNAGEIASGIAIECVKEYFSDGKYFCLSNLDKSSDIERFLKKAIVHADKCIKKKAETDPETSGMGTTIVLAWIRNNIAHIAWCGDSRAYLFNPLSGLCRLSKDHSYVQQLVDSGKLEPELAMFHPNSNIIIRSLGDSSAKAEADYMSKKLSSGDIVLLCSDGLCGLCQDDEIMNVLLSNYENIGQCAKSLIDCALEAGGTDNVTVALFQCVESEEGELNKTIPVISSSRKRKFFWRK